ncbi:hypothetical protein D3C85_906960 [compost metagenome]
MQAAQVGFATGHQIVPGVVEVDQHQDAGLHRHPGQGDKAHPHRHREVEVQQPEGPDTADHGERQCGEDQQHLLHAAERQIEQQHYDGEGERHHVGEARLGPLHVFVLTGPGEGVARRQHQLLVHLGLGLCHKGADVAAANIHVDPAVEARVLAAQHGGLVADVDAGHVRQGDPLPLGGHQRQQLQAPHRVAVALGIAQVDGIALAAFDGLTHVHAADGGGQHRLHVGDVEAIAGRLEPVYLHLDVAATGHPLGVDRGRPLHLADDLLELLAESLDHLEIRTGYLDADRGLDAGGQHVDAGLDGGHPGVGEAGELDEGVELLLQLLRGHAGAPLVAIFKLDAGLHHHQIGRVGGAVGAPRLAEHVLHLGHGADQLVGLLQYLPGLAHRDVGRGGGHVHDVPLIERRYELGPQISERPEADDGHRQRQQQGGLGAGQHGVEQRDIALT